MILVDRPKRWSHGVGRGRYWSHLISTLPGMEGTTELVAFAARCGLAPRWRQHKGQPTEHYDVTGHCRALALLHGAKEVDRKEFVEAIRAKRRAKHAAAVPRPPDTAPASAGQPPGDGSTLSGWPSPSSGT